MVERVVVVGAGAWGLPAAAELARRGHRVTLVDRVGPAPITASSHGATRIWRLAHPDRPRVRMGRLSVRAWEQLESRSGIECRRTVGLLWRGGGFAAVAAALAAEGVEHERLDAGEVGRRFPGLAPTADDAVWQPEAGIVLAAEAIRASQRLLEAAGGEVEWGRGVTALEEEGEALRVVLEDGTGLTADRVVVAAGPWSQRLLADAGVLVPLRPVVSQVTYLGGAADESLPCLIDGNDDEGDDVFLYAMPTPGRGYKMGLELPLRELDPDADTGERMASEAIAAAASRRVQRILPGMSPVVTGADVCTWTYGPDGRFVVDTALDGRLAYACGDSGEGFKFSALMGEWLADLAEGRVVDDDLVGFGLARFGGAPPEPPSRMDLGK